MNDNLEVSNKLLLNVLSTCRAKSNVDIEQWKKLEEDIKSHLKGLEVVPLEVVKHKILYKQERITSKIRNEYEAENKKLKRRLEMEQKYTKKLKEQMAKATMALRLPKV